MRHLFIINPISFRKKNLQTNLLTQIERCMRGKKEEYKVHVSRFPRDAILAVHGYAGSLLRGERLRVYACGGDGIMFDCLNGVVGMDNVDLAVVPCGRENGFADSFGVKNADAFLDLPRQAKAPSYSFDALRCAGNYTLGYCTVGMETAAVIEFKRVIRSLGLTNASLRQMSLRRLYDLGISLTLLDSSILSQTYEAEIDGEHMDGIYGSINISNCNYFKCGRVIIPDANPHDGQFDCLFYRGNTAMQTFSALSSHIKGKWERRKHRYLRKTGRKMTLRSWKPLMICLDGEIIQDTELKIEIAPAAAKIVLPFERQRSHIRAG
jgi:diacylglycerol kinase family enzyme